MKKLLWMSVVLFVALVGSSFLLAGNLKSKTINFKVRGNSKFTVELGVGYQVGSGSCCRGVSKESTVGFQGQIGDVLYDSKTRRVITKVYADLENETIDLREYY